MNTDNSSICAIMYCFIYSIHCLRKIPLNWQLNNVFPSILIAATKQENNGFLTKLRKVSDDDALNDLESKYGVK